MKKLKILIWDIETTPNLGYTWGKYEQNIIEFVEESKILSVSCKWVGEKQVRFYGRNKLSEKQILEKVTEELNEADVSVAHNGDQFDVKRITARLIANNLPPLKPLVTVDTKKVAKKHFGFNSNSLNDLGKYLGLGVKAETGGFSTWLGCMNNDKASWAKMEKYNKQDVLLLEKLYLKLKPWILRHPNLAILQNFGECPKCTSKNVQKRGIRANAASLQQQMHCKDCKGWYLTRFKKEKI